MGFTEITQSTKRLNFLPRAAWKKTMPPVVWQNYLIAGFSLPEIGIKAVTVPTEFTLCAAIFDIYGKLSLPELARLYSLIKEIPEGASADFFKTFNLRESEEQIRMLEFLPRLPLEFQQWCEEKDLGVRDLTPLRLLWNNFTASAQKNYLQKQLCAFTHWRPAKNLGAQILELFSEIMLQAHAHLKENPAELDSDHHKSSFFTEINFTDFTTAEAAHRHLQALRYPMTFARDQKKSLSLKTLPWPLGVQAKHERTGDESRIEVKFSFKDAADFTVKLEKLKDVAAKIQNSIVEASLPATTTPTVGNKNYE